MALLQKHYKWYIESERKTEKLKEQVNRWMDQQADGQTDSQTDKQTDKQTEQTFVCLDKPKKIIWWPDGQTEGKKEQPDSVWIDRQTNRQPNEQTSAETDG